jgi:hypothetical protein
MQSVAFYKGRRLKQAGCAFQNKRVAGSNEQSFCRFSAKGATGYNDVFLEG